MKNIAVFVSGNGTNLQAIIDNIANKSLKVRLALVVSDKKDAFALLRAKKAGKKILFLDPKEYGSKESYEKALISFLSKEKVDFIVLAGFMRILSPFFVRKYKNRILNIHPSLLPAFKGGSAIRDAFNYGVKTTGVTVHFVDEEVDHGPIIAQEPVEVLERDTEKSLEAKIHKVEHKLYSQIINRVSRGKYSVKDRKVVFCKKG